MTKITKLTVSAEVVKSANYKSVRCGLSCECDIDTETNTSKVYNKIYGDLFNRCDKLVNAAIIKINKEQQ